MKYIRTKDGRLLPVDIATHELTQYICDAGYFKTLDKGSYVTIGRKWSNFYGYWVDIIDEKGLHYSIRPDEVKYVTRELPQVTIEELCDGIIVEEKDKPDKWFIMEINEFEEMDKEEKLYQLKDYNFNVFIKTDKGLIYVAKMNEEGELELI